MKKKIGEKIYYEFSKKKLSTQKIEKNFLIFYHIKPQKSIVTDIIFIKKVFEKDKYNKFFHI